MPSSIPASTASIAAEARGAPRPDRIEPAGEPLPRLSVIVGIHDSARRSGLEECLRSVLEQSGPEVEVVVVVDGNPLLAAALRAQPLPVRVVDHRGRRGVSSMRNAGIDATTAPLVAFIDDDAIATPGWTDALLRAFDDEGVLGIGGAVRPSWNSEPPSWFPEAFDWAVGGTSAGMPATVSSVRNLRGGNMCYRRSLFAAVGAFNPDFGHDGSAARYCDETEFCMRASRAVPGGRLMFDPTIVVEHRVDASRTTLGFFVRRCFDEGRTKGLLARGVGSGQLAVERRFARTVVPRAIARGLGDAVLRGDPRGLLRAGAVALGSAAVLAGLARGRLSPAP